MAVLVIIVTARYKGEKQQLGAVSGKRRGHVFVLSGANALLMLGRTDNRGLSVLKLFSFVF